MAVGLTRAFVKRIVLVLLRVVIVTSLRRTRGRINHEKNQEPEYQADRQEDKSEYMVCDEIEDPDEKPEERGNSKEPAASDNGLLWTLADQREKDGDTEREQKKRYHLYPLLDSRISGYRRHGLPKVLPRLGCASERCHQQQK